MSKLMISCQKATELIEKRTIAVLSWHELVRLRMHLMICEACKRYEKQSRLIDDMMKRRSEEKTSDDPSLDQSAKQLIDKILSKGQK